MGTSEIKEKMDDVVNVAFENQKRLMDSILILDLAVRELTKKNKERLEQVEGKEQTNVE